MQNLSVKKVDLFTALLIILILFPCNVFSTSEKESNWLDKQVSITFRNEPLRKVLSGIAQQASISIIYAQELANEKVNGDYNNLKALDAITRLFNGKNKVIQINSRKKIISIKTFGAKNFIWAGNIRQDQSPYESITLAELNKLHEQQNHEYISRIVSDNEISVGGITLSKLNLLHEQQNRRHQTLTNNGDTILENGMTLNELNLLHEQQNHEYQTLLNYGDEALENGMTLNELNLFHKRQNEDYQARIAINGEIEITPEGVVTLNALNLLHEHQYKEYSASLNDPTTKIE